MTWAEERAPAAESGRERLDATVIGRVQGVGFRWFVNRLAARLALVGWVANLPDGSVRVVAEGRRAELDELERALHDGPSGAYVERVELADRAPATGGYERFEIRSGGHSGD